MKQSRERSAGTRWERSWGSSSFKMRLSQLVFTKHWRQSWRSIFKFLTSETQKARGWLIFRNVASFMLWGVWSVSYLLLRQVFTITWVTWEFSQNLYQTKSFLKICCRASLIKTPDVLFFNLWKLRKNMTSTSWLRGLWIRKILLVSAFNSCYRIIRKFVQLILFVNCSQRLLVLRLTKTQAPKLTTKKTQIPRRLT
jgi:hypothetical protein